MSAPVSFANWSLKKAQQSIPDSFARARFNIIYLMLALSIVKGFVVLGTAFYAHQPEQIPRAIIVLVCYTALLKIMLSYPSRIFFVAHVMAIAGILLIWTNAFLYTHRINVITFQFIFMAILGSFYALGNRAGLVYTILAVMPVVAFLFIDSKVLRLTNLPHELASPGFEIVTILNFVTIAFAHYYFFKAFRDSVDEKEKLNKELEISVAEARKLAEAKSLFLSTMSHELRTPLNSVIGVTELITRQNIPEQKENLSILHNSAQDLLSLINNVLDINKLEWGKMELEKSPFKLYDHLQNVCAALKVKSADKHLNFVVDIDDDLADIIVISDSVRLSQVLYNLVGNAIKFTEQGHVIVKVKTKELSPLKINFSIEDTGIGIHAERQQAIFQSFTQAQKDTARKYGGTGLGLSIVQQVLGLFNTKIDVVSEPGFGSKFSFTIQFETVKDMPGFADERSDEDHDLDKLTILVAEDNAINRAVLQKQLDILQVKADFVNDGAEAFIALEKSNYDAVFLDLDMPVLNGYETLKKVRQLPDPVKSQAHLVAFTASVMEQEQIAESGFNDFLYKPVSMHELRVKLERIIPKKS